jgi:hypothetical protein
MRCVHKLTGVVKGADDHDASFQPTSMAPRSWCRADVPHVQHVATATDLAKQAPY